MPTLLLAQNLKEAFSFRLDEQRRKRSSELQRRSQFLWDVRHGPAAFARMKWSKFEGLLGTSRSAAIPR